MRPDAELCRIKGPLLSYPYIIWTMRRTGGTTLATLLSTLSEHAGIQHEPFNRERRLGHVSEEFEQSGDVDRLRAQLHGCLEKRPLVKHCYEIMSPEFNAALLEVATALGYRHIILDRRNETDRIVSLELAYLTGAWGGEAAAKIYPAIEAGEVVLPAPNTARALRELRLCNTRRMELARMTGTAEPAPFVIYFEDVYSDPQQGRALIARILAFLEIRPEDHAGYDALVDEALTRRGQNSARILAAVPDIDALVAQLEAEHAHEAHIFAPS